MLKFSPQGAVKYTKYSVFLVFTWPLPPDSRKSIKCLYEIVSWIFIVLPIFMGFFILNSTRYHLDDHLSFTKEWCIGIACVQVACKMLVGKAQYSRLQKLHGQVGDFLKNATPREMALLQRYVNRCRYFHLGINICALLANCMMIVGPLILPQRLPVELTYPFSVEKNPAYALAYLHQVIVGFQCSSIGSVDCQVALLLWFAGARLELLAEEFSMVKTVQEFDQCIRKHQDLVCIADEAVQATRYVTLTTIIMTILSIITGGVQLVSHVSLVVKFQFCSIVFGFMGALFISAWPAENLINTCKGVGTGAYNCFWPQASAQLRQKIIMIVLRSRKYSAVSFAGILPELSLSYYSAFLSKTYSFFTALRILLDDSK